LLAPGLRWSVQEPTLEGHEVATALLESDPEGAESQEEAGEPFQGMDLDTDVDAPEPSDRLDRNESIALWIRKLLVLIRALDSAAAYDRPVVRGLSLLLVGAPGAGRTMACRQPSVWEMLVVAACFGAGRPPARECLVCQPEVSLAWSAGRVPQALPNPGFRRPSGRHGVRARHLRADERYEVLKPGMQLASLSFVGSCVTVPLMAPPRWRYPGRWHGRQLPVVACLQRDTAAGDEEMPLLSLHWAVWDDVDGWLGRPARLDHRGALVWSHPATRRSYSAAAPAAEDGGPLCSFVL
jgi:hypothetical protein